MERMKKLFCIILAVVMPLMTLADTYPALWKKVTEAKAKDLPKSQMEWLDKIVYKAQRGGDYGQLLKAQLLADNKCKDADQLAEMGFFNIDNLCINENFSISEDAITFFYNPLEIACYAVGEVSVAIPFEKIQEYIKKDSPICRLF